MLCVPSYIVGHDNHTGKPVPAQSLENGMSEVSLDPVERPKVSNRDHAELRPRLVEWLRVRHGLQDAEVPELSMPSSNGMSSETLLFDIHWREQGEPRTLRCVGRLPPDAEAIPVFPVYDLEKQFLSMKLVGERSQVPVPKTLWYESDESWLGAPFFVMERIDGEAPPDVMPYPFGSWLQEGTPEQQRHLQDASVAVLAGIHAVRTTPEERAFLQFDVSGDSALRRHVAHQRAYYEWVAQDGRSPLIERCFVWLEAHWPESESEEVISWGDSRIGNMLYRDFTPVAVLDWEMVGVAPREVDLGWMLFLHHFFQDFAVAVGVPGMPDFMKINDVAATYQRHSGYAPRDIRFFMFYAALRHAIVMLRVGRRSVHFGQAQMPADADDLILHRASLEIMMDGSYWTSARLGD